MNLVSCLSPVEITRYGEKIHVPCGKCLFCRHNRQLVMNQRIKYEIQSYKFNLFVTLTYADMFLPRMRYLPECKAFSVVDDYKLIPNNESGLLFDFPYCDDNTLSIINSRQSVEGSIPYLKKYDLQTFFKRLRINISRCKDLASVENEKLSISYAACGEYGPSTFRPHFHIIINFDSSELAVVIADLIRASWYAGNSRCRFLSEDEDGSYISQYINCAYNLPNFYKLKGIRPFLLVSKSHPLGCRKITEETLRNIVKQGSPTVDIFDNKRGLPVSSPLWSVLENWLFPKCSGFDRLPNWLISRLYRLVAQTSSYKEFCAVVLDRSPLEDYPYKHLSTGFKSDRFYEFDSTIASYFALVVKHNIPFGLYTRVDSALRSLYYAGKRVVRNMHRFCVDSIDDYIDLIVQYNNNKEIYLLHEQLKFEKKYSEIFGADDLVYIDFDYFDNSIYDLYDVKKSLMKIKSDIEHSHKNKKKNDYLSKHPEYKHILHADDLQFQFS